MHNKGLLIVVRPISEQYPSVIINVWKSRLINELQATLAIIVNIVNSAVHFK